jgi:hypothetical protein
MDRDWCLKASYLSLWWQGCTAGKFVFHRNIAFVIFWIKSLLLAEVCPVARKSCHVSLINILVTISIEQSPSLEADSRTASQEISRLLLNPKVHYRVHKSLPLVPSLSQLNPAHIPTPSCSPYSTPASTNWLLPYSISKYGSVCISHLPHTWNMFGFISYQLANFAWFKNPLCNLP